MDEEKEVRKYIKKYLKKGYKKEELKKTLTEFGYSKKSINNSFKEKEKKEFKLPKINFNWYVPAAIGVVILILIIVIFLMFLPKNCDYDKECFIKQAIEGNKVSVKEDVVGSTLKYTLNGNTLTKEISQFSDEEPEEVIVLLKGKKIRCEFEEFSEELIDGVFGGIEQCEGELLDIIYELEIIS